MADLAQAPPAHPRRAEVPQGVLYGDAPGEYVNEVDGSALVWVPGGSFRFGRGDPENGAWFVRFATGYFIGKYEVTWAQWTRFVEATGFAPPPVNGQPHAATPDELNHPVSTVCVNDVLAYCAWAGLRLPSEAEWEYAARGNLPIRFPWGNAPPTDAHLNDAAKADEYLGTSPVGSYPAGASPFGCLDMAGNVWEWVADGSSTSRPPADGSALEPSAKSHRARGGSFRVEAPLCRAARRESYEPARRRSDLGFRLAK
jgi:formylglycine-generating enzyme required for sulfatase activity